jgi:CheY-like chemotaxis protein
MTMAAALDAPGTWDAMVARWSANPLAMLWPGLAEASRRDPFTPPKLKPVRLIVGTAQPPSDRDRLDSLSQNRVVVVDDDSNVRMAIKAVADRRGFAIALAANSSQFREIYQSFAPSTVFLDLNLPDGEDGVELLRFLAQQDCKAQIVLISSVGTRVLSTVARLALVHGLDLVTTLKKPIAPPDLEEAFVQAFGSCQLIKESDLRDLFPRNRVMRQESSPRKEDLR